MSNQTKQIVSDLISIISAAEDKKVNAPVKQDELSLAINDIKKLVDITANEELEFFLTKKSKLQEIEKQRLEAIEQAEINRIKAMTLAENTSKAVDASEQTFNTIGSNTLKIIDDMTLVHLNNHQQPIRLFKKNKYELSFVLSILSLIVMFSFQNQTTKKTNIVLPKQTIVEVKKEIVVNHDAPKIFNLCDVNDIKVSDSCVTPDYTDLILNDILNKSIISNKRLNLDKSGLTSVKKEKDKVIKTTTKKGKDRFNVDTTGF